MMVSVSYPLSQKFATFVTFNIIIMIFMTPWFKYIKIIKKMILTDKFIEKYLTEVKLIKKLMTLSNFTFGSDLQVRS